MENVVKFWSEEEKELWMRVYLFYLENNAKHIHDPEFYADKAVITYRNRCNN